MAVYDMSQPVPGVDSELTICRGKAGRSRPHQHYRGRYELGTVTSYVSRCTSCGRVIEFVHGTRFPALVTDEADVGRRIVASL